jgi:hypothetical protein
MALQPGDLTKIPYPTNFPCPTWQYTQNITGQQERKDFDSGWIRQRKPWREDNSGVSMTFVMSTVMFNTWTEWCVEHAYDWFNMFLENFGPNGEQGNYEIRFITPISWEYSTYDTITASVSGELGALLNGPGLNLPDPEPGVGPTYPPDFGPVDGPILPPPDPPPADPFWDDVIYLVNMNDTVGTHIMLDRSPRQHTMAVPTQVTVSNFAPAIRGGETAIFVPPGAPIANGTTSSLEVATWNGFEPQVRAPITFEFSFYALSLPSPVGPPYDQRSMMTNTVRLTTLNGIDIYQNRNGGVAVNGWNGSVSSTIPIFSLGVATAPSTLNTLYNIAVTFDGVETWYLYKDGIMVDSAVQTSPMGDSVRSITLGGHPYAGNPIPEGWFLSGYIDEARITEVDRYGGNNYTIEPGSFPIGPFN